MIRIVLLSLSWLALFPQTVYAIPSPDLVINIFASLGQILGLLSVTFGGMALSMRKRGGAGKGGGSPWPLRIALIFLAATAVSFAMYYSYTLDLKNKRLNANLTRSSTEEGKKVGDVSLKTISFSDQVDHPNGVDTETLAGWLKEGKPLNLIDVREPEETEAGMIADAFHRRYPDIRRDPSGLHVEGKTSVLLCFSGNRSSELSEEFSDAGKSLHFMVGGYEKWLAEGRPVGEGGVSLKELRKLPYFVNNDVLLDTPEVETLVHKKDAVFVDVRYPGDFESGHLPGAVNIPLRKMPTDEMNATLNSLDKSRPVIAPCYDKRSCFYASILGLRLSRFDYEFLGRYTVPHEYVAPARVRDHVKRWKEEQRGATFFGVIGKPIQWLLYWIQQKTNAFTLAILFTVFALRFLLLPFSIKTEVDRLKEAKRAPQIAQLKKKLKEHPRRLARAIQSISRQDRMTPIFNMVGNIVQMILFIVLFSVVGDAAKKFGGDVLWMKPVSEPDPWFIMPLLSAGVVFLHMYLSNPRASRAKMALYIGSSVAIFLITFQISGALNIYLSMSIGLLLVHGVIVRLAYKARAAKSRGPKTPARRAAGEYKGVVPLRFVTEESGGGNKALKLGEMMAAGFPVPDGFVISDDVLKQEELTARNREKIEDFWNRIDPDKVAVRSSGLKEDGSEMSYAGIFESVLDVTRDKFYDALDEVKMSLSSSRAEAYSGASAEAGGIVVQEMVRAEYAGVMFTEHPGSSGSMMIEMVEGLGESLVSGQATPESYQFGKYSGRPMFEGEPPIDLSPLMTLGKEVERHFNGPQDIEWAFADDRYYLLQTRDITSDSRRSGGQKGKFERERYRVLNMFKPESPDEVVLRQNELSELLPRPTRLSLNIMQRLWEPGGAVDLACGALGIPYEVEEDGPSYVLTAFGSLYVNCKEEKQRASKSVNTLAAFRMSRAAEAIEREFREDFLPGFLHDMRLRDAVEFGRLPIEELIKLFNEWERAFITRDYFQAEMINVAAEYYMRTAEGELRRKGEDPARFLSDLPQTIVHRAMSLLPMIRRGKRDIYDFLDIFGHRAPHDFELSMPRYRENIEEVMKMASRAKGNGHGAKEKAKAPELHNKTLALAVDRARRFQTLKEEAKHHCLREFAQLRRLLLELDNRLALEGGIFHLDVDEVLRLGDSNFTTRAFDVIENRRQESFGGDLEQPPIDFTVFDLEKFGLNLTLGVGDAEESTILRGIRISGVGEGYGRVRVLTGPEDIDVFEKGEILVTRFTDPTWTPLFSLASGVITEVGGWLSHAAIVAREMNLVGIVNVRDATRVLKTGDFVRLHVDGTVEIDVTIRREGVRFEANRVMTILVGDREIDARLVEIGHTSALFEMEPAIFDRVDVAAGGSIRLESDRDPVGFSVIEKNEEHFKIEFEKDLDTRTVDFLQQDRSVVFDKTEKARAEKTRLLSKVTEIKSEINIRPLCQKAMNAITELLQADRSSLFLYDDKTDELWSIAAEGADSKEIRFPSEFGIAGSVFTTGETVNIEDAYEDPRFNPEVDKKTNYRTESILCMPVKGKDGNVGVIQVLNKKGGPFTRADERMLGDFASQALVALENALQFDEARNKTRLLAAASELQSETDLIQLLSKTMSGARELLNASRCTLFLNDEETDELWTILLREGEPLEVRFPSHIGLTGACFQTREKINIPDAYADPRFNPQVDQKTNFRTRSVLCVPLGREGECIGVLQAVNKRDGVFTAADEEQIKRFADVATLAFENARLVSEAARIKESSECILENVTDGVITVDGNNRIEKCNAHIAGIFKADARMLVDRRVDAAFENENRWVMEYIEKLRETGDAVIAPGEILTLSDGEKAPVDFKALPLVDDKENIDGLILIFSKKR